MWLPWSLEHGAKGSISDARALVKPYESGFEHKSWPACGSDALENYGDQGIEFLLTHFSILFGYLGGDAGSVAREWSRLKSTVMRDPNVYPACACSNTRPFTSASLTTPQSRPTRAPL